MYVKALIYRIIRWANINWIQVVSAPMMNLPNTVMPPHMMVNSGYPHDMVNSGYVHFNPMQQVVTSSDPLSCFNVGYVFISLPLWSLSYNFWFTNNLYVLIMLQNGQSATMWDSDVQNLYSNLGVWLRTVRKLFTVS